MSKQITELERLLGVALFARVRKRLVLNPAGAHYQGALALLENATLEAIASANAVGGLNLACLPTFAAKWLIPRLPSFYALHPRISLTFLPFMESYDFHLPQLDCAIRYGTGFWPQADCVPITGHDMVVIAPPGLSPAIKAPADLVAHTLLHHLSVPTAWARWAAQHQASGLSTQGGTRLDQYHSLIRAVMAGMGVALVPQCLVQDDIGAGVVEAPLAQRLRSHEAYYLCFPPSKASLPALVAFREWLLEQAD